MPFGASAPLTKLIQMISHAELIELFDYSPDTGQFTRKVSRAKFKAGEVAGRLHGTARRYWRVGINGRGYLAHRLAWFYVHGVWPLEIDHINGDPLDNRLCNLRTCTRQQNTWNRGIRGDSLVGVKGVGKHRANRYRASIWVNGRHKFLGAYRTAEAAGAAYALAAYFEHGEFAHAA